MTIGIAVCLTDGALLIADGKRNELFPRPRIIQDDVDKIHRIGNTVSAISLGIDEVTQKAVHILTRDNVINGIQSSPEEIMQRIVGIMDTTWNSYVEDLHSAIDRSRADFRAGLLVGGITGSTNFVSGVLVSPDGHTSPKIETRPLTSIIVGAEEHNPQCIFQEFYGRLSAEPHERVNDAELEVLNLSSAGVLTIKAVEDKDADFGGKIKCVTIRRDYPYCVNFV